MYEYESDEEEEEVEEGTTDGATVAQEQVYSSKKNQIKNRQIFFFRFYRF
jgi:hypothetical protein